MKQQQKLQQQQEQELNAFNWCVIILCVTVLNGRSLVHHLLIDVISVVILFLTTKQQQQQQQQHQQQEQQQEVQWSACYVKICTVLLLLGVQITALVCWLYSCQPINNIYNLYYKTKTTKYNHAHCTACCAIPFFSQKKKKKNTINNDKRNKNNIKK
jgi:hypothetical protein